MLVLNARLKRLPGEGVLDALLRARGLTTPEEKHAFLHPAAADLPDPFALRGMDAAAALVREAMAQGREIVVYGDYDADGVCATALLVRALRRLGARVSHYIPAREEEGYGLNAAAAGRLADEGAGLLITVDCGITATEEVRLLRARGVRVIVSDHHTLQEQLPEADAVLHPARAMHAPLQLCGAGVSWMLCRALEGGGPGEIELAALATIADMVPLLGENRAIARLGLAAMAGTRCPGLTALLAASGVTGAPTAEQAAFQLAPRINAAGRLATAETAVRLLLTDDAAEAAALARTLCEYNDKRRALEAQVTAAAREQAEATVDFVHDRAIVVCGDWPGGVCGLAAGKLAEAYRLPAVVLSRRGDTCVGSARSVPGVHLFSALHACRDLLVRFGGHAQAAGLTIAEGDVDALRARLNAAVRQSAPPEAFLPAAEYDLPLPLCEATHELLAGLSLLEPCGMGNPAPVFLAEDALVAESRAVGANGAHLKLTLAQQDAARGAVAFGKGALAPLRGRVDAVFTPVENVWQGVSRVECRVSALRPRPALESDREADALALLQEFCRAGANTTDTAPPALALPPLRALTREERGTLVICRTAEGARRALCECPALDLTETPDRRAFHTLALRRVPDELPAFSRVALYEGALPGELARLRALLPGAAVYAGAQSPELAEARALLALRDDTLRAVYRLLRAGAYRSLEALARAAALSPAQAACALHIFAQLGFIAYTPAPFALALLPAARRSLSDSPLYRLTRTRKEE